MYGLIPAIMVWRARKSEQEAAAKNSANGEVRVMPGRLQGGDAFLGLVALSSAALILPEAVRILGSALAH